MKTIRWGIIGVGNVCEVKSGPGFQKATNSELVAVMRRDGAKAEDFAKRHNVPRWYDDGEALINDDDIDAIYIATPPSAHKAYTLMAAAAGKPVYVEKPMAMNFAECQAMIAACEQNNVPLWVAYYRRCLPRFVKIKDLIESGAIGDVRSVAVTLWRTPTNTTDSLPWRVQPEIAGGGIFVDVGVHTLDFLDYVFGEITSVNGFATNQAGLYPAEDNVVTSFEFASGVVGTGSWCFTAHTRYDNVIVTGSKGTLSFPTFDDDTIVINTDAGEETLIIPNPPHVQQPLIQTIVDELNGNGHSPSSGISGARTTWVTDQILQAYYAKQA